MTPQKKGIRSLIGTGLLTLALLSALALATDMGVCSQRRSSKQRSPTSLTRSSVGRTVSEEVRAVLPLH